VDDVITQFDGKKITSSEDLANQARQKRPGDEVAVEVLRGEQKVMLKLVIGRREGRPAGPPPPG
jgi:S1-C subfamily serine protease